MPSPTPPASSALLHAFACVLRPLVRLLIARGVNYQKASELLKRAYVESACADFAGADATGTRLSLLTGLNRKEIRRLTTAAEADKRPEDMLSFAAATHAMWRSARRWRDRHGKPKALARKGDGRGASFEDLVRAVTLDHRPAAVFNELARLGYIREDADGMVHLVDDAFVSAASEADRLTPFAENLADHADAAVDNVLAQRPPHLERAVFSDELSAQAVAALDAFVRAQWQKLHDETIRRAIQAEEDDIKAGRPRDTRFRLGVYVFTEKRKSS
jgi:hypothetical protein